VIEHVCTSGGRAETQVEHKQVHTMYNVCVMGHGRAQLTLPVAQHSFATPTRLSKYLVTCRGTQNATLKMSSGRWEQ
jgi:hypothetical protein